MIIEFVFAIAIKLLMTILCTVVFLWLFKYFTMGICRCGTSMKGKIVLITGGHEGVGLETVKELAKRNAKIIIGINVKEMSGKLNVKEMILQSVPQADIDVMWLDLSSKDRIQHFANEIKAKYAKIDVLINNSSMMPPTGNSGGSVRRSLSLSKGGRTKTADGFELVMGANYFGHAFLNHLLLDMVKAAGYNTPSIGKLQSIEETSEENDDSFEVIQPTSCSRIIIVSSPAALTPWAHQLYKNNDINFDDGPIKNPLIQYSKSKLAQLMYATHLAKHLREENSNTIVMTLYPGFVPYGLADHIPQKFQKAFEIVSKYFGKTLWEGAQTSVYLSVKEFSNEKKNVNGRLFLDCRPMDIFKPRLAKDAAACQRLWNKTEELLGLNGK